MSCAKGYWRFLAVALVVIMAGVPRVWAAAHFKTLHRFGAYDGWGPVADLVFDADGNLYGTTTHGAISDGGTVFRLTSRPDGSWSEKVLYRFCSASNCSDGQHPTGSLVFDKAGNLYGVTVEGGSAGYGVVFKLAHIKHGGWTEKVLHSFDRNGVDGVYPAGGLTFDQKGNLYGLTDLGGVNEGGVVFRLMAHSDGSWTENVLYDFCSLRSCADGSEPIGNLIFDKAGNLYGTATRGGLQGCSGGCGVVFQLASGRKGAWKATVLHRLRGGRDGKTPMAGLTFDQGGNLFGTTALGGVYVQGTVFELIPTHQGRWQEKVVHAFRGGNSGSQPFARVILDAAGNVRHDCAGR